MTTGSWAGETAILKHDGQLVHVSQVLIAHKNSEGGLEYLSTVMRDMTERRQAEEALHNSQRKRFGRTRCRENQSLQSSPDYKSRRAHDRSQWRSGGLSDQRSEREDVA